MKKLLLLTSFCISSCFADVATTNDQEQVATRLKEFTDDISQGKTDNIGTFWTEDAQVINPLTGQVINGRNDIAQYLQKKAQDLKGKEVQFHITRTDVKNPNLVTVQGVVDFYQDGKVVDQQAREVDLVKDNGIWYLDFLREIHVDLAPTLSHDHLKELDWLLGNWKDKDQDVTISYDGKWDRYKNFIIQRFDMSIYGLETLEGRQIITWDPIEKKIRSWIFDSDGGFGQGTWTKTDEGWSTKIDYTLATGETATSTNMYTKISPSSYTYSSIDRKVGDTKLPNVEPTVVKKED